MKSYYKFLVVRHPLDRLASAYKDKLAGRNRMFERLVGSIILRQMRQNASEETIQLGKGVTFKEYVNYLSQFPMKNVHFKSFHRICLPCAIKYDYIAKLETHNSDSDFIIRNHLSGKLSDKTKHVHAMRDGAKLIKHLHEYDHVTSKEVFALQHFFHDDMFSFGYTVEKREKRIYGACRRVKNGCC